MTWRAIFAFVLVVMIAASIGMAFEAAERISAMMAFSLRLLEDGAMHAVMDKGDAVGALNAAARLIKSNADVTHALVLAVQGETRHRSINQPALPGMPGLNPNFPDPSRMSPERSEELREILQHRIDRLREEGEKALGNAIVSADNSGRKNGNAGDTA